MRNTVAAIDFQSSKIVTLIAGLDKEQKPGEVLASSTVQYDGFMSGRWNAPDEQINESIKRAIQEVEAQSRLKIKELYVGVPGDFLRVERQEFELPLKGGQHKVTAADVDKLMAMTSEHAVQGAGEVIHRSPAWFSVDDTHTMEPVGLRGSMLRCLCSIIVADAVYMDDITTRLHSMEIEVKEFLSPALGEALMIVPPEDRDKTAALVDIGYLTTEIMAVEGDALTYHEVLPMGGGHLVAELAYGLGLTMSLAEQLKRKYIFGSNLPVPVLDIIGERGESICFPREQVVEVLEPLAIELAGMIGDALGNSETGINARSALYVTGGGLIMTRGGKELLSKLLDKQVKTPISKAAKLNSPVYSSSLGLMELVMESVAQEDEPIAADLVKKAGSFFKNMFTK